LIVEFEIPLWYWEE